MCSVELHKNVTIIYTKSIASVYCVPPEKGGGRHSQSFPVFSKYCLIDLSDFDCRKVILFIFMCKEEAILSEGKL
jgi:hypothetical protein